MSKLKWGDKIPQVRRNDDGTDSWYHYGEKSSSMLANVGAAARQWDPAPSAWTSKWEDVPTSTYVPSERIKAMDEDGVDVHTIFANTAGASAQTFNGPKWPEEFRLECIRAFNDYEHEEWDTPYPGRFITMGQVPLWDVRKAVDELRRTAQMGLKAITFAFPQQYGYPHIADPYWDPLWDAAQETELSINMHIGSGGSQGLRAAGSNHTHPALHYLYQIGLAGTKAASANTEVMSVLLFSGILERFPRLKFVSSESSLGWVPYVLEAADRQWEWLQLSQEGMPLRPSEYFRRQCYVNFWHETFGVRMREHIGVDNILWLSDFPHIVSSWPNSREYIERWSADLTAEEKRKILVDNAVKVFHLDADEEPGAASRQAAASSASVADASGGR